MVVGPQVVMLPETMISSRIAMITRLSLYHRCSALYRSLRSRSEALIILSSWSFPYTEGAKNGFYQVLAGSLPRDLAQGIDGSAHIDANQVDQFAPL